VLISTLGKLFKREKYTKMEQESKICAHRVKPEDEEEREWRRNRRSVHIEQRDGEDKKHAYT
jgi:hypothetical protein